MSDAPRSVAPGNSPTPSMIDAREQAEFVGSIDTGQWESPLDYLRRIPSGVVPGGYDENFGRGLGVAHVLDEAVRRGVTDRSYTGMSVTESYSVDRGKALILSTPPMVIFGIALDRGVAYQAPGVERGYLLGSPGRRCELLDATTGKLVEVDSADAIEVSV